MSNVRIFRNLKYHWTLSWFAYVSEGFASKVIVLLRESSMFIYDFKINKFYSYMLRGSSRSLRGSDIARNIKILVLRKLAEAIFKRKHSRKLRLWSRKLCGSPRGTWGLRQAVLKGINDTAHLVKKFQQLVNFCLYNQKLFASAMVPLEGFFFYPDATQSLSDSITHSPILKFNTTVRKTCLPFTHPWLCDCRFQEVCKGMLQDSWALARQSLTGDSFSTWDRAQDSWSCQVSPFCSFLTPAWARSTQLLFWLGNEEFWHN